MGSGKSCGVSLAFIDTVLLIVALAREGKLDGAPACQHDMTILGTVYVLVYGFSTLCVFCIAVVLVSFNDTGKCCGMVLAFGAFVALGTVGIVVTHDAACSTYDGSFLWIMVVVNGSITLALAGVVVYAVLGPACLIALDNNNSNSSNSSTVNVVVVPSAAAV
jgi:hypothetical protein